MAKRQLAHRRYFSLSLLLISVLLAASSAFAQGTAFSYQGKLTDAGTPASGNYDMQFLLFDTPVVNTGTQQGPSITNPAVQVTSGIFTVQLDFGQGVFDGSARYLEIGVRPAGNKEPYTPLSPRQPITATPYSVRSMNAAAADGLSVACVNCVTSSQILTVEGAQISGAIPVESVPTGSGNYIQNAVAAARAGRPSVAQEGGFDLTGDGMLGGSLIVNGGVGIGKTPSPGIKLDVLGNVLMTQANGGAMQFGTPNSETGMSNIVGSGRADLRFNGTTLKLVVGPVGGPPPSTNGIVIDTLGIVRIGDVGAGSGKFQVTATGFQYAVVGTSNDSIGVFGKSVNNYGVYGESTGEGINSYAGFFNGRTHVGNLEVQALGTAGATAVCYNSLKLLATCSSSLRYKKDFQPFGYGLSFINQLRPIAYKWKADNMPDIGFGAEDVAKINPLFVTYNAKGEVEGVKYDRLSVVFVNAFKEQQKQIEQQQIQIEGLKKLICLDHPNADICKKK
jgi:Chaperone of endosialidase